MYCDGRDYHFLLYYCSFSSILLQDGVQRVAETGFELEGLAKHCLIPGFWILETKILSVSVKNFNTDP